MYEPVAVSIRITSPSLMKGGTWTTRPVSIRAGLPTFETEAPLIAGSVSNVGKPAKMETGLVVQVPPFINEGDVIRIDTSTGSYIERASK